MINHRPQKTEMDAISTEPCAATTTITKRKDFSLCILHGRKLNQAKFLREVLLRDLHAGTYIRAHLSFVIYA